MSINEFLLFLASAGGASASAAFIAERLAPFQALPGDRKSLCMLGISLLLALVAWAVLTYVPEQQLQQIAPIFQLIYGVMATWMANQFSHTADPARSR